ncbi:Fic family protein [Mycobacterium sp. NPDC003449]
MPRPEQYSFISFEFDAGRRLTPAMWLDLGEAMSKCQHLAGVPLKPAKAEIMGSVYLARGVQATTAIEGNTLTETEVELIVEKGSANVGESRLYQEREVQNVLGAIRDIDGALRAGKRLPITRKRLEQLNLQILDGIPDEPEVVPGRLREHNVSVGKYRAPQWQDVPELVDQFVRWLAELRAAVTPESPVRERFINAVLAAMLAHLYIAWIHPFGNGNGRLARLVEVQILSESGVVPIVATNLLSDFYNKTRDHGYYRNLDAAQRDAMAFIGYALGGFLDELRDQIEVVKAENVQIHWESYVYDVFRKEMPDTETRTRQRELALAMPEGVWITAKEATDINTTLARFYAKVGDRTPTRDLNDLTRLNLAERDGRRYRVNRSVIRAFIPPIWEAPQKQSLEGVLADRPPMDDGPTLFDE